MRLWSWGYEICLCWVAEQVWAWVWRFGIVVGGCFEVIGGALLLIELELVCPLWARMLVAWAALVVGGRV